MLVMISVTRALLLGAAVTVLWLIRHPVVAVIAALAARALYAWIRPYRTCRWCRPGGLIGGSWIIRQAGYRPRRKPGSSRCWRCRNHRLTRRLGAYHVHKLRLSLVQAWAEQKIQR